MFANSLVKEEIFGNNNNCLLKNNNQDHLKNGLLLSNTKNNSLLPYNIQIDTFNKPKSNDNYSYDNKSIFNFDIDARDIKSDDNYGGSTNDEVMLWNFEDYFSV